MSVRNILDANGKIQALYLPPVAVDPNPTFESVAIAPDAGVPGVLSIENPAGDAFQIVKGIDGFTRMFQDPVGATANLAMAFSDDGNSVVISAQSIELGDATDATPTVQIIGSAGLSQVYDKLYNPVLKLTEIVVGDPIEWTQALVNNGTDNEPVLIDFTPTTTGYYALVNTIAIDNAPDLTGQVDPTGIIEGYVSVSPGGGPTEVFVPGGNFIFNCSLAAQASSFGGATPPLEWTQTCMFKLTAGTQYNISISGLRNGTPGGVFNCPCFGELIQMC
jgi:hypothetical protein